ncbi:MAG: porphobilinogen synthase [Methanothrix sp.]|jgi:porphobilinogen synthase|nr:porphobilinogen synthase [Methanothrix sp.]HOI69226.1 porphobilinogen synthase [Methanothrix sp.]HPY72686.1 porphobilinogen synthase [Methanothrix sp.]HQA62394.1 porphobilinogen synthase [Methanothrix sp.]
MMMRRMRRLRKPGLSRMVAETRVSTDDLIMPLFVDERLDAPMRIESMPGQFRHSIESLAREVEGLEELGVPAVILFGLPDKKDEVGSGAWDLAGVVQQAIERIKETTSKVVVIADLCLCEYTSHGHCGVIKNQEVANDETLPLLGKTAVSQARAGADVVAPSGMMDHMVAAIRGALDEEGFGATPILSYAAKYASSFYGPFREAAESGYAFGDRSGYQMDPANALEALWEVRLDIEEGADMVMVKPAMPYLDILRMVKDEFGMPTAAYQVSGEYSMIMAAAERGWLDGERAMMEALTSIKRAGADMILTYYAKEFARKGREG